MQIPKAEFGARAQELVKYLCTEGLSGAVLFDNYYVTYFTDFAFTVRNAPSRLSSPRRVSARSLCRAWNSNMPRPGRWWIVSVTTLSILTIRTRWPFPKAFWRTWGLLAGSAPTSMASLGS